MTKLKSEGGTANKTSVMQVRNGLNTFQKIQCRGRDCFVVQHLNRFSGMSARQQSKDTARGSRVRNRVAIAIIRSRP